MKRIKSINGYTIYQATARDVTRHNVEEGYFYLYFSSDIRAYGLAYSYIEMEAGSLEEAEAIATGSNYAAAPGTSCPGAFLMPGTFTRAGIRTPPTGAAAAPQIQKTGL